MSGFRQSFLLVCVCVLAARVPAALAQCGNINSPYAINAHAPSGTALTQIFDQVQAAGMGWVRIDFNWFAIETSQDVFDWSVYDVIVAAASARGLRIFAGMGYTPPWATSGPQQTGVPNNAADWYDICFRAAQRYPTIQHWGMWNEPDSSGFWAGTQQQYIDIILKNGADAIHAANSNAKVCGPELDYIGSHQWYYWLQACINQAGSKLDIVTQHVYNTSGNSGVTSRLNATTAFGTTPSLWGSVNPSVREVLVNTGWFGKPFWLTETGWASDQTGESTQATYYTGLLTDWFTGQANQSWVNKIFFYEIQDDPTVGVSKFGILRSDYSQKPSYTSYKNFITAHPAPPAQPCSASGPMPVDGQSGVGLLSALSWTGGANTSSHNVYFGTVSPGTFRGNQIGASFDPGRLAPLTTYYWRIDEVGLGGLTTGDVWRFTTGPQRGDFDFDGDVDQSDFGYFQRCLSGSGVLYFTGCASADFDGDSDVDGLDTATFLNCMTGADLTPGC